MLRSHSIFSSVGTGTDGVHTISVDDIVFDVFTSPSQLQEVMVLTLMEILLKLILLIQNQVYTLMVTKI